jgi:hypothetical protein
MLLTLEEMHHETAIASSQHKKHPNTALCCCNCSLLPPLHLATGPTNTTNSVIVEKYNITSMPYEQNAVQNRKAETHKESRESMRKFKYL